MEIKRKNLMKKTISEILFKNLRYGKNEILEICETMYEDGFDAIEMSKVYRYALENYRHSRKYSLKRINSDTTIAYMALVKNIETVLNKACNKGEVITPTEILNIYSSVVSI